MKVTCVLDDKYSHTVHRISLTWPKRAVGARKPTGTSSLNKTNFDHYVKLTL